MTAILSREEGRKLLSKPAKRHKFNARKVVIDGHSFPSQKEADRYVLLRERQRRGEIANLELQPVLKLYSGNTPVLIRSKGYPNGRQVKMVLDFAYFDADRNRRILEDVKGFRTREFILKKAYAEACYPGIEIIEV